MIPFTAHISRPWVGTLVSLVPSTIRTETGQYTAVLLMVNHTSYMYLYMHLCFFTFKQLHHPFCYMYVYICCPVSNHISYTLYLVGSGSTDSLESLILNIGGRAVMVQRERSTQNGLQVNYSLILL